jgi:cellobiose transport system permease protein
MMDNPNVNTAEVSAKMRAFRTFRIGRKAWPYVFLAPFLILYAAFNMFPILYSFVISFTSWDGIGTKTFIGWNNYKRILTVDPYFFKAIGNTLLIMVISIPGCLICGIALAAFLFQLKKAKSFFQTINFIPYITTPVAIGLIFAIMFDWTSGAVNTTLLNWGIVDKGINWLGEPLTARLVLALLLIWKYTGYHMTIYLAGMAAISGELFEAAKVDGSSSIHTFFTITVPLVAPVTMFLFITDIIGSLQLFEEPQLLFAGSGAAAALVGGPGRSVLTVVWHFYDVTFTSSRFGYGSAVAFLLFVIIVLFSLVSYKLANKEDAV